MQTAWSGVQETWDVTVGNMSSSRPNAAQVTYVTIALGVRLPRQRELCCSRPRSLDRSTSPNRLFGPFRLPC